MPRTEIPITTVDRNFSTPFFRSSVPMTTLDATNDMQFQHSNTFFMVFANEDASGVAVAIKAVEDPVYHRNTDLTFTIPAGNVDPQFYIVGGLDAEAFRQADGKVYVDITAATDARVVVMDMEVKV